MRWFWILAAGLWLGLAATPAGAADFRLADGTVLSGELVAPRDNGVVIRRSTGGLTERLPWDRFAQETLREFAKDPALTEFVEVHLEVPDDPAAEAAAKQIEIKPVPGKIERPEKRPGLMAAFATPAGLFIIGVLWLASLYAAYEISIFRNYPAPVVMGIALLFPVIGPILFLCLPTRVGESVEAAGEFAPPEEVRNEAADALAASGLAGGSLALGSRQEATATSQAVSFKKGEVEFGRRFFESQLALFFRMVRSEADKNLVLVIKSSKGEFVGTRITRISGAELGLQLQKGNEVLIRFGDISEVHVRAKAA